jgi:hypothetical protein
MIFKEWLLLNENIEENFNKWLELLFQYTKKNTHAGQILMYIPGVPARADFIGTDPESWDQNKGDRHGGREYLNNIIPTEQEVLIKFILKEKNIENFNWFSFSIGFLSVKPRFLREDLELAIDVTKRRINNGDLPKTEIGEKGWLMIGFESLNYVREYLQQQQTLSNRQKLKLRKTGETLAEDENLIKLIEQKDDLKLYFLPRVLDDSRSWDNIDYVKQRESRKRLLCKYGKGTDWCTANPTGSFHEYYTDQDIYILHENDQPKYQFTGCHRGITPQFMDVKDFSVQELSEKDMEFLQNYLGDCYENISVAVKDGEEYFKLKFKDRISLRNLVTLCNSNDTSSKVLEDIYFRYQKRSFYLANLEECFCENPNTPEKVLEDIYNKKSSSYDKLKIARLISYNPNTPEKILADVVSLIDKQNIRYYSGLVLNIAKNPNSNIKILKQLFEISKSIENNDFRVQIGVEILKNKNSKQSSEFVENVVKIIIETINHPETYDFTISYLIQQKTSIPDYLRKKAIALAKKKNIKKRNFKRG